MQLYRILFLLLLLPRLLFAQKTDSAYANTDNSFNSNHPKKLQLNHGHKPAVSSFIIPAALIIYGFVAINNKALHSLDVDIKNNITKNHPGFHTSIDDYLQYVPAASVFILDAAGVKSRHNLRDRAMICLLSGTLTYILVRPIKNITKVKRPDTGAPNSFPSGHSATAFASAGFLYQEYKHLSAWYGVAGYSAAAATGILRMLNNRHWFKDVVAGAGFGILSSQLTYLLYPKIGKWLFRDKTNEKSVAFVY